MSLQELKSNANKRRKRVGRGNGSGMGTYCCRGMNGQSCRAGGRRRPGFEGGQTSYIKRMPKLKGFTNVNRIEYQVLKTSDLNIFENGDTVDLEKMLEKNLVSKKNKPVKLLLGKDKLEKQLTIIVHKASATATKAVGDAKGELKLLTTKPQPEENTKKE